MISGTTERNSEPRKNRLHGSEGSMNVNPTKVRE